MATTYLTKACPSKFSRDGDNSRLRFGLSETKGWMRSMENKHTAKLNMAKNTSFFEVYDGFEGDNVAKMCAKYLHSEFKRVDTLGNVDIEQSITDAFFIGTRVDDMIKGPVAGYNTRKGPTSIPAGSGSTACVAILRNRTLVIANAGDCRCVVSQKKRVYIATEDHKPNVDKERERITKAGGHIRDERVNGSLNVTRCLGEHVLKGNEALAPADQIITAKLDVTTTKLPEDTEFIVLACDGIWDCMTNEEVINFVHEHITIENKLSGVCEKLLDNCIAPKLNEDGRGCDNMTVILIVPKTPTKETETTIWAKAAKGINLEGKDLVGFYNDRCGIALHIGLVKSFEEKYLFCKEVDSAHVLRQINELMPTMPHDDNTEYSFPLVSTGQNQFVYDEDLEQICRLRGKGKGRSDGNSGETRETSKGRSDGNSGETGETSAGKKEARYICSGEKAKVIAGILEAVKDPLTDDRIWTTRSLYYRNIQLFLKQRTVDDALVDVCLMLEVTRSSLHIFGASRGAIMGPIVLNTPKISVDCANCGVAGTKVPLESATITSVTVNSHVKFILVVEKETIFTELASLDFTLRTDSIMVTEKGSPDLATRALLSKLQKFVKVPIYALVDPNPYGLEILCTYKYGSERMAHENLGFRLPSLQWIGIYPLDFFGTVDKKYHMKLTPNDIKKARSLSTKGHVQMDEMVRQGLEFLMVHGVKGEIECTSALGTNYLMDKIISTIQSVSVS